MAEEFKGTGYEVLALRLQNAEEEIKNLKQELKQTAKDNGQKFEEINDRIDRINEFTVEIRLMMANFTSAQLEMKDDFKSSHLEMKENIKTIAASAGKDAGWRALLTDIIKAVLMILGFILGGKWLL